MKHLFSFMCALLFLTGCTDDTNELSAGNGGWGTPVAPAPNEAIDAKLFEVINLDYPGLEKVKAYYEQNEYYFAAQALLEYYRTRTNVVNPDISLMDVVSTADDKLKADYALEYRFFINNYYEDATTKQPYLFKREGKIDWAYNPLNQDEFQKQLHRHQWMVPQAKVYRTTRDEKYVKSWIEVYSDWLKQNPMPENGLNDTTWWQLQVSERVDGQIQLFSYYMNSVNFTPQWFSTFLVNLNVHAEHLMAYPYADGNILISQARSLTYAGILFPELKSAESWKNRGVATLSNGVKEQFLADGMQFELDLSYHIAAISDLNSALILAQANNQANQFPADFLESLRKATEVVMHLTYPNFFDTKLKDHCIPGFNDTRQSSWSRSVLTKNFKKYVAMFPDNSEMNYMASVGKQGTRPSADLKLFSTSGYYVLRNGWEKSSTMMIHTNNRKKENKPVQRWEHNQPDNGTFELYHNGRNFFPDSGVFAYEGDAANNKNREWYRSTRVHNTLTLEGKTIATAQGELLKATAGTTDLVVTQNQGYGNMRHRRATFFVDKTFFVLVDEAIGSAAGTVNLNFNLCEGSDSEVVIDPSSNGAHTAFADQNNMIFRTFGNATLTSEAFDGKVSYTLGQEAPRKAYSVNMTKEADKAARYITVLLPVNGLTDTASIEAEFDGDYSANGAKVKVTVNGRTYNLNYNL